MGDCIFCGFMRGEGACFPVFEDATSFAFLDSRPLARGHVLVVPKEHVPTLLDLPQPLVGPFFENVQRIARGVEKALSADGVFTAVNTRVSQSVLHLHVHIVPRWNKDGLFSPKLIWRRRPYVSVEEAAAVQELIRQEIA